MHTKQIAVVALVAALASAGLSPAGEKKRPSREKPVLRVYDVQELVLTIPDFPGPELDMAAANSGALPVFQAHPPSPTTDMQDIVKFITRRVDPESWGEGWGTHISQNAGRLIVLQTPAVHRRIESLLGSPTWVSMPSSVRGMIVAVNAETAGRLRRKVPGPMTPAEVEKLAAAAGPGALLASPQVICANDQRAHAWLGQQSAYVGSYSVSGSTPCPNVHQLLEGTVFDVRPTLSFDESSADVVLRFTVAGDRHDRQKEFFFLSDETCAETAAGAKEGEAGEKARPRPVHAPQLLKGRVRLPDVRVLRLRNTISVPLGKYTLAGTLPLPPAGGRDGAPGRVGLVLVTVTRAAGAARAGDDGDEGRRMITRVYDVRELTGLAWNFPGPQVGLQVRPAGGAGAVLAPPPPAILALPSDALAAVVTKSIEPDSWGREGASIRSTQAQLVVHHTAAVHARIRAMLTRLREQCRPQVSMSMLVLAASDEVAAKVRGRDGNQFAPAEAEKLLAAKGTVLLAAPQLCCSNNQRVHAYAGRQVTYVSGFSSSGSVTTPDISTAVHGWVFDVRPVLSPDHASATAELRFTMTGEAGGSEELGVELVPAAGKRPAVANHLTAPKAEIISVRNSISVPIGKYVLAGTCRRTAEGAKAAPNVLVLLRAELIPASGK